MWSTTYRISGQYDTSKGVRVGYDGPETDSVSVSVSVSVSKLANAKKCGRGEPGGTTNKTKY
jgi:hypothetical protein